MLRLIARLTCVVVLLPVAATAAERSVPLIDAAREGDVKALRVLLQQGVEVNLPEPDGSTALHWAADRGDLLAIDLLLRAGARATVSNRYGVTPLSLAAASGNAAIVDRLIKSGANPNAVVYGGETVLMTAARAGRTDTVRTLIEAGADANAREATRGQTALMWAAAEGHADVIRVLIEHGADIGATSHGPSSPEDITAGDWYYSRPAPRLDVFTPLQFAVQAGHVEATAALLEAGGNINDETPDGSRPASSSAARCSSANVTRGVNPCRSREDLTVGHNDVDSLTNPMGLLTLAIANAHFDVTALLIEKGADVNAANVGWTPLHQLVRVGTTNILHGPPRPRPAGRVTRMHIAKMLLAHGADVDARTTKPWQDGYRGSYGVNATPFLLAAKGADTQMMLLLAANGADVTATNALGTSSLMAAAGVEMSNPNEDSGRDADALAALRLALKLGAGEIDAVNQQGDTALHGAIRRALPEFAKLLVEHGAKLDVRNKGGLRPIDLALGRLGGVAGIRLEAAKMLHERMLARGLTPPELTVDKDLYNFGVKVE